MKAAEILRELVAIATPSALSNLPLLSWVTGFVEARGWRVELFPYTDENGVAKANLIARPAGAPGTAGVIDLAFVCHTDTVPFAEAWTDALKLTASDEKPLLHGCGACDVKGALACFLAALEGFEPQHVWPNAALILTADEEIGCKGMERLLAGTTLRIRTAIVSEPTSLRPGIAGKGYGLARVRINGLEAHSAYPQEGLSAIVLAAKFIARIESELSQFAAATDELFDPPQTTLNVGVIQGGSAKNIVARECSFLVEWRPIPGDAPRAALAGLEWLADRIRVEHPRARIHVEPLRAEAGFAPATAGPLRQRLAVTAPIAREPIGISFGSEASRLSHVAEEVIVIGPGDMHTAHSNRECVPTAELDEWTETLHKLLSFPKKSR